MASTHRPRKGILKTSSSFDQAEHARRSKEMKWDEMNILATHHPPDKDYGHMKVDEPPTPYRYSDADDGDEDLPRRGSFGEQTIIDPANIASRLEDVEGTRVRRVSNTDESDESSEEDEKEELTEEDKVEKHKFEQKRKLHYNEFQAVKLAKQLMAEEEEDDEEEEEEEEEESAGTLNVIDNNDMQTDESGTSQAINAVTKDTSMAIIAGSSERSPAKETLIN